MHVSLKKDVVSSEDFLRACGRQEDVPAGARDLDGRHKPLSTVDLDQQTLYHRRFGDFHC
jgi:hypothetical protein